MPAGVRFLVAAVDIQDGNDCRFVVQGAVATAWGSNPGSSTGFPLRYLDGSRNAGLDMSARFEDWQVPIDQVIQRAYPLEDESGRLMPE